MAARVGYNKNSSAIKRIMQEARELANDPSTDYSAAPLEDDIFEWHCTIRGPSGTEFEGGLYHFRILLPSEYPFRPPAIMMLTPNGRFELNTKICISFTNYHEELWQPAWGVRTAIIGLQGFFPLKGTAAVGVGALEYPASERKRLAALSREWVCPRCNRSNLECLPDPPEPESSTSSPPEPQQPPVSSPSLPAESAAGSIPEPSQQTTQEEAIATPQPVIANGKRDEEEELSPPVPKIPQRVTPPLKVYAPTPTRPVALAAVSLDVPRSEVPTTASTPAPEDEYIRKEGDVDVSIRDVPPVRVPASSPVPVAAPVSVSVPAPPPGTPPIIIRRSPPRPPILLDTAICVLLVLVFALICRRIL